MRISRIAIKNFRNFREFSVALDDHAVFVGANDVGKSNLLHALRLVLDPSLPDSARQLRAEDYWDGLPRPLTTEERIEISVDLTDFEDDDDQLAVLAEYLVQAEPMVARLTYMAEPPTASGTSDFSLFGGEQQERRFGYELRKRLPLDLLHALRDAETDLASWRRSPLRPLVSAAWNAVPTEKRASIAKAIDEAASTLTNEKSVQSVEKALQTSLTRTIGTSNTADVQLGVTPTEPDALIRIIRLLVDGGRRTIADAGLGASNVLYVTLKLLEIERLVRENERDHTFVAIEEPEAHLHPHLQRQVYRDFLRLRPHLSSGEKPLESLPATILLTTHSPHIASIAPLNSLILLRSAPSGNGETLVRSTVAREAANAQLTDEEREDIERYLEVSRAEILFSRGVILVEGEAELYILPRLAELLGCSCDQRGISVASIGGTHFASYALLLDALGIPFAIVTDGDPNVKPTGISRVRKLLTRLGEGVGKDADYETVRSRAAQRGVFIGSETLELDLCDGEARDAVLSVLEELGATKAARERAADWRAGGEVDADLLLSDLKSVGKGRFAQRLAASNTLKKAMVPTYIEDAINYLVEKLG